MAGKDDLAAGRRSPRAVRARRAAIVIGLLIAAVAAGVAWRAGTWSAAPAPLSAASAAQIEQGRALYAQHCASCHGANLEGEPAWRERKPSGRLPAPPHDDSGHTWHHPDEVLLAITRKGMRPPIAPVGYQSDMPGFEGVLDEAQIRAVLGFIASRWSEQSRAHQARIDRAHRDPR
ncbi:c-type cytochrome [Quisquiliibacterium transsilvanicum]|jgi:mono/diheme cytochrome c family protein|uniref:Mono/diheme cytochrome c family protein n=1 Tax=Quisquiliibacterium transsilvanicum TaxID=1549638 RepID=A0A7W8HFP5_9BURK|nr:cytochrome c [Quisquiliibacterium transsilvanicum]MBB5271145.1 mono/diheme cytochrome c family protein [Quisquiliibacterium transsilvanicum]